LKDESPEQTGTQSGSLSPLAERGRTIYEERLKAKLEPEHDGEAVTIHVDTGDLAIGNSRRDAALALLTRHALDERTAAFTIRPLA